MTLFNSVLVTGGAGYVGSALVPSLLEKGYNVKVLDLYLFGDDVLEAVKDNPRLEQIKGDLRDLELVEKSLDGVDAVIHLACISNDPSFELDLELGKSINFDAFEPLVRASRDRGIKRFVYASSSSVYGVSDVPEVTEEQELKPLTDYSKFKALCEEVLLKYVSGDFTAVVIRPATVCGYAPRQRLDVIVNILTNHAYNNRKIRIFGGEQKRPNIHIDDMVGLYLLLLELPDEKIKGRIFNAGYDNLRVKDIAAIVKEMVEKEDPQGAPVECVTEPTDDPRSYHISSEKIRKELGFIPKRTIADGVVDLVRAFKDGRIPDSMGNILYYNIKTLEKSGLL